MNVEMVLEVPEEDVDPNHPSGMTNDAYERLAEALMGAGFTFVSGPDAMQ